MAKISEKKYKEVILYLAEKLGGEIKGKKKLAKLLYFVDFDFFEKFQKSLTGDVYKALPMGPFPITMERVLTDMAREEKITIKFEKVRADYNPTEIYRVKKKIEGNFSKEEQQILDRVVLKYGNLSGKQLEDLTHAEAPYIGTAPNQEIAYELAYYRGTNMDENA
ncbi:MAG: Panacea domain-containing protein [Candidatus Komeilibacteria bacterium]|nr:Panacea domain-containing protein [Candidatus Komeilibacteria bacterium]